jgi:tellurite resistance protein
MTRTPRYTVADMKLESATLLRLRDVLLQSGRRPSSVLCSAYETLARSGLLSAEESAAVSRVEPLAEVMYLMMAADGHVAPQEQDAIRGALRGLSGDVLRTGIINVMLEQFEHRLNAEGRDARLADLAGLLAEHSEDAEAGFVLAAAVALADGEVDEAENALINQLCHWFHIDPTRAEHLLDDLQADSSP